MRRRPRLFPSRAACASVACHAAVANGASGVRSRTTGSPANRWCGDEGRRRAVGARGRSGRAARLPPKATTCASPISMPTPHRPTSRTSTCGHPRRRPRVAWLRAARHADHMLVGARAQACAPGRRAHGRASPARPGSRPLRRFAVQLLRAAGVSVHASTNARLGHLWATGELVDDLGVLHRVDVVVLELTSSHLAFMSSSPDVAVVTSFWPDHSRAARLPGGIPCREGDDRAPPAPGRRRRRERRRRGRPVLRRLDPCAPVRVLASTARSTKARLRATASSSRAATDEDVEVGPLPPSDRARHGHARCLRDGRCSRRRAREARRLRSSSSRRRRTASRRSAGSAKRWSSTTGWPRRPSKARAALAVCPDDSVVLIAGGRLQTDGGDAHASPAGARPARRVLRRGGSRGASGGAVRRGGGSPRVPSSCPAVSTRGRCGRSRRPCSRRSPHAAGARRRALRSGVPALAGGARGVPGPRARGGRVHPCARLAAVKVTMLLADFAQVADGKLTVVGGGWSLTGPELVPFGIALLIQVPWDRANQRHVMRLELLDADGQPVLVDTDEDGEQPVVFFDDLPFEVGRPPGLKPGTYPRLPGCGELGAAAAGAGVLRLAADDRRRGRPRLASSVHGPLGGRGGVGADAPVRLSRTRTARVDAALRQLVSAKSNYCELVANIVRVRRSRSERAG